jgi:CHASE3 domain sensor protein
MARTLDYVPRVAIFLAGVAAGALTNVRRTGESTAGLAGSRDLRRALANLEARLAEQESATANRFSKIETRLEEHAAKLADVPSTAQIVSAMEQLLSKTMASLDERLTTQARSIEVLKTTVSQTDSLLERVLESLDSLQSYGEGAEKTEDALLRQPA